MLVESFPFPPIFLSSDTIQYSTGLSSIKPACVLMSDMNSGFTEINAVLLIKFMHLHLATTHYYILSKSLSRWSPELILLI